MDDDSSEIRRDLIKSILTEGIWCSKLETSAEKLPSSVSVIHLPSSTLQLWKRSYLYIKFLALLLVVIAAIGFFSAPKLLMLQYPIVASACISAFVIGGVITFIISLGENALGLWRYEKVGTAGLLPVFQWRYISIPTLDPKKL